MNPVEKESSFTCIPIAAPGPDMSGAVEGCDFQATLVRLQKKFEGGGFYVLSEFSIEGQGFRYGDDTMAWSFTRSSTSSARTGMKPSAKCRPSSTRSTSSAACA